MPSLGSRLISSLAAGRGGLARVRREHERCVPGDAPGAVLGLGRRRTAPAIARIFTGPDHVPAALRRWCQQRLGRRPELEVPSQTDDERAIPPAGTPEAE